VRSAERQLAGATARIGVAKASLFPALSISGNIGSDAATIGKLGSLITGGLFAQLAEVVFDGGRRRSQVRSARAGADLAFANYKQTGLRARGCRERRASASSREGAAGAARNCGRCLEQRCNLRAQPIPLWAEALRYEPPAPPKKSMFGGPPEQPKNADVARGARQQLWVVGADGKAKPMPVTVGHTNGTVTEVSGPGLRPGLKVITGQLTGAGK
jgi:hypothetical protein